jgi:hypothetical protein
MRIFSRVPFLVVVPVTDGYAFGTPSAFCAALMPAHAPVLISFRHTSFPALFYLR